MLYRIKCRTYDVFLKDSTDAEPSEVQQSKTANARASAYQSAKFLQHLLALPALAPLALLGTVGALMGPGVANNFYVQIGLMLLIALSAKNAILIVDMAR